MSVDQATVKRIAKLARIAISDEDVAKLAPEHANLVLEEFAQRLDELQTVASHETLGNTSDVVVGLDGLGRTLERDTLDDI